jgi:hypothetical protein
LLADLPSKPDVPTRISDGQTLKIVMKAPLEDGGS